MKTVKRIIYISAFAVLGAVSFSSCEDFLTAENKSAGQTADEYFSSEEGLASLRTYAYYQLKNIAASRDISEIYVDGTDLYTGCRGRIPSELHRYIAGAGFESVKNFYVYCYSLINFANGVLHYGEESGNDQYAAEMHFLRAYGYYLLTQQFGRVPYITSYIADAERNYPRTDLKTIYDGEIAALEAVANDSHLSAENHTGVVSQRAVKALLAKLNLAAGWDLETTWVGERTDEGLTAAERLANVSDATYESGSYEKNGTSYFAEAARWADEAIAGQGLTMPFDDKWSPFNEGNAEEIFSVQYEREGWTGDVNAGGHGLQNDFGSYYGSIINTGGKYCGSKHAPSLKALYLWESGDTRYEGTFMTTVYNYEVGSSWGDHGYYAWYNVGTADETNLPIAYRYFPAYTTRAEADAYIAANASRLAQGANFNPTYVRIMSDPIQVYEVSKGTWDEQAYTFYIDNNAAGPVQAVKKWDDPQSNQENDEDNGYRDVVVLHLSEIYLVAAEAYYMAGDEPTSLERLNAVRARAGASVLPSYSAYTYSYTVTPAFQSSWKGALDVILDERARELYAENYRWMDLRRTKQLVRYNVAFNSYIPSVAQMKTASGVKLYKPIPTDEINSNTALMNNPDAQNPGY